MEPCGDGDATMVSIEPKGPSSIWGAATARMIEGVASLVDLLRHTGSVEQYDEMGWFVSDHI